MIPVYVNVCGGKDVGRKHRLWAVNVTGPRFIHTQFVCVAMIYIHRSHACNEETKNLYMQLVYD